MLVEQCDQTIDAFGQFFHGEGDVFDDHRGAGLAHCTDSREGVFADAPELVVNQRVFAEINLLFHREAGDRGTDLCQLLVQQRLRGGAGFDEQRTGTSGQALHPHRHALHVLHRAQAAAVEQLDSGHRLLLEHRHCVAASLDIGEDDQRTGLVRMVRHGVVGHRTDEAEGPFGANHQVGEDIHRLVVIDERVER
ncbi:hypothetical protein D3C84_859410 [compost metagenome]